MRLERSSPCKVNLLLNILNKRADGFHELETLMQPVPLFDELSFETTPGSGLTLTCSEPALPTGPENLIHRAAALFQAEINSQTGLRIHLEKRIPMAAGLGGGSGDAATTLLAMNELFGAPLSPGKLHELAAKLGSDVPFFLQNSPALATGRGELIQPLPPFPALEGTHLFLIHPGFGIATAWAYQQLSLYPEALHGQPGRAARLAETLTAGDLAAAGTQFYNSLEAPALHKYPILAIYQEFFREEGAAATLMSGSGSTTFAIFRQRPQAESARAKFPEKFGRSSWMEIVAL